MGNANIITLLNEVEKLIDHYMQEFKVSEDIDKDYVGKQKKTIKQHQRAAGKAERKELERQQNEEKQKKRQEDKDKKTFVKIGKMAMARSDKPTVTRVKEVKKVLTEEQMDMKKYLQHPF